MGVSVTNKTIKALEFDKIVDMLCGHAVTENAKQMFINLVPSLSLREVNNKLKETTEARKMLDQVGVPPLAAMKEIEKIMELAQKGAMLLPEQLMNVTTFIASCKRMKNYLKKAESLEVDVAYYGGSINELSSLFEEINIAIRNNAVDDNASKVLKDLRRKSQNVKQEAKTKLDGLLRSKKEWFADGYVSIRNGHFVLPVKKEFKNQVSGSVLDISSSGSTYFIEPNSVMKLEAELSLLQIAEDNEERKILYILTALVEAEAISIKLNMEAMETLDFMFAKAKLSFDMKAIPATMNVNRYINIISGRHPLIKPSECVPLDFSLGNGVNGVVITGPNTGGKTVALKTVGLLQLMAQSGLHIPCEAAELCLNNTILCDIGDGQSITENLSTFSSHISNIIHILDHSDKESLVLLDELGSGTDPAEGMGIAISILEELQRKGCLFLATTHYPEVKEYANITEGLMNARMAFDRESLKPLYKLELGEAGESCALYIAKRLGLPKRMLERAYEEAYCKGTKHNSQTPDATFLDTASEEQVITVTNSIEIEKPKKQINQRGMRFNIGDSVVVYPQKKIGIVYKQSNEIGEVGVQIQKTKQLINHKRLQLKASASELYPEDYDFSIIFDSVANRKAMHSMDRKYQPGLEIVYEKELK